MKILIHPLQYFVLHLHILFQMKPCQGQSTIFLNESSPQNDMIWEWTIESSISNVDTIVFTNVPEDFIFDCNDDSIFVTLKCLI